MKRIYIFFIIILLFITAGCAGNPAAQSQNPTITIVNNTGFIVWFLYMSPVTDESWGNDRLGPQQVIQHGQSVSINLPFPLNVTNRYDIMLITPDDDRYIKMNVQVTPTSQFVFNIGDLYIYR